MAYQLDDTIAAAASAPGGGARGVVRLSGPDVVERLARCFSASGTQVVNAARSTGELLHGLSFPQRIAGAIVVDGAAGQPPLCVSGALLLWPSARSYTRQPAAEFHTIGSPPLLAAVIEQLGRCGVRQAEPGEFTLRAFVAGRIDLTQAEAVLGVIDARDRDDLDAALDQLAGGLSLPLHGIRDQLLAALAELEAGLDFVEEDIEFIDRAELRRQLHAAQDGVARALAQLDGRDRRSEAFRVALIGPPNAGKSSLFNALLRRLGSDTSTAIVSPAPGSTRDFLSVRIEMAGIGCELIDTAGEDDRRGDALHAAAQQSTAAHKRRADLRLQCIDAAAAAVVEIERLVESAGRGDLVVATKSDLALIDAPVAGVHYCSSATGAGLGELASQLAQCVAELDGEQSPTIVAAATAARCAGSLQAADRALAAAVELTAGAGQDELIAADLRAALDALGEVVGAVCTDDLLDRIFSQFCIGK